MQAQTSTVNCFTIDEMCSNYWERRRYHIKIEGVKCTPNGYLIFVIYLLTVSKRYSTLGSIIENNNHTFNCEFRRMHYLVVNSLEHCGQSTATKFRRTGIDRGSYEIGRIRSEQCVWQATAHVQNAGFRSVAGRLSFGRVARFRPEKRNLIDITLSSAPSHQLTVVGDLNQIFQSYPARALFWQIQKNILQLFLNYVPKFWITR